ncbi:MAG: hypothetical protein ACRC5W_10090 [Cetobacterium sp.]|uniref:hypothetical protein n=1 Tax=Cetobacterium sp. TaxID=2071632 RepID=UPI003F345C78
MKLNIENLKLQTKLSEIEIYDFLSECLEKRGKIKKTKTSENCIEKFQSLGLCNITFNQSIREYLESIDMFGIQFNKKTFETIFLELQK